VTGDERGHVHSLLRTAARVTILLLRDPAAFAQHAWDFLEAQIECNILATVLSAVRSGALAGGEVSRREDGAARFACVLDGSGRVQGAALRTPPRPMLASPLDPNDAEELIGPWMAEDPGLDAVNAVAPTARALAAAWARRTGGRTESQMRMAMHMLQSVTDPPHPASGRLVPVAAGQLETLIEWWAAFAAEADLGGDVESIGGGGINRPTVMNRYDVAYRIVRPDGEIRYVHGRRDVRRAPDGTVTHLFGTTQDVTEQRLAEIARREAQELFETAFSQAPIRMALIGLDGSWPKVNCAVCMITGWPESDLLRRTFQDITHPADLEADLAQAQRLLAGEITGYQIEKRYLTRTGLMPTPSDGDALYRLANRALYEAKQNGRNRTCCHAGDPSGRPLHPVGDGARDACGLRQRILV
jgi:PAS domain S-box-containing protein